ncbi:MAG: inorganic phosphate transporter [Planctomycetales bacterium]|nr:inorganic phosphate transporter [Planctomycetales bacterium]MBN8627299.1 inorganic phosphate transporter [Planctomycetota bacterium]
MTLILCVILVALVFEYINGFHDTANSIATVVATKVLTPRQAVTLAATTNLVGALWGTAVAKTIASGLVDARIVSQQVLICALLGAIVWNLVTWYWGLPSSSSHALVGGLVGAAVAAAGNWDVVIWSQPDTVHWYAGKGLLWKVVLPMFLSPAVGFVLGMLMMGLLYALLRNWKPRTVNAVFGKLQMASAAGMGFMHGTNDAQKTMGIIALALAAGTMAGEMNDLPALLSFLRVEAPSPGRDLEIAMWIKITCAIVMASGTAAGGWRIIKTLGHKMVRLQPVHGFAAETTSATIIGLASHFGIPVSTTHNISAAIMGVGAAKRLNALKWTIVEKMVWAWLLTIPISGAIAYGLVRVLQTVGQMPT